MAGKRSEQIKAYIVVGLALVLVISAYLRFIQAKVTTSREDRLPSSSSPLEQFRLPQIRTEKPQNSKILETAVKEYLKAPIRDIFEPLGYEQKAAAPPPPEKEASKPLPTLNLKGTIVGGKRPIAIINDLFVRPGDWIGDYRVARIGKKDVLLDSGKHKILLEILKNE